MRTPIRNCLSGRRVLIIAALYTVMGCAGFPRPYESPAVTLSNMTIKESRAFETAFLIELRVLNTSDTAMEIKAVDCTLEINGKPFAVGVSGVAATIPAYETKVLPVVVYSSVLDTANRVIGMIRDVQTSRKIKDLEYVLKGKLRLSGAAGSVPFHTDGMLNLESLTGLKPASG